MADFSHLDRVSVTYPTPDPAVFEKAAEIQEQYGIIHEHYVEFLNHPRGKHGAVCPEAAIHLTVNPNAYSGMDDMDEWYATERIVWWAGDFADQMRWTDQVSIAAWTDENEVSCEEAVQMLKDLAEGARRLRALEV